MKHAGAHAQDDDRKESVLYPFLCASLVALIYFVFLLDNLVPQLQKVNLAPSSKPVSYDPRVVESATSDVLVTCLIFHAFFFMFIVCILRASLTPAGHVDQEHWAKPFDIDPPKDAWLTERIANHLAAITEEDKQIIRSIPVVERRLRSARKVSENPYRSCSDNSLYRFCEKGCNVFKPDRCHHCRVCKRCVLRMDHHCPWIANCVGFANYKFFLLMLFYGILCICFVLGASLERFLRIFEPSELGWISFLEHDLAICLVYVLSIFVFMALVAFFSFHLYLVLNSLTTIELKEKKTSTSPDIKHRFRISHIKVDRGYFKNFLHIFGPCYMWLLPIAPPSVDDGSYTKGLPEYKFPLKA